jgi:ketosteroid isomerase-like protein
VWALLVPLSGTVGAHRRSRLRAVANSALVRSAIDAYNRRDLDALRALMTEDVELRPPVFELTGRAYLGHAGISEWLRDVDESFAKAQIVPIELHDIGDRVLAMTEFQVEGHAGRVELGSELGLVCDVADGRIASWLGFFNHAEARRVAEAG